MAKDFPSLLDTPCPYLDKTLTPLPEDVLSLVDDVIDNAIRVLGTRRHPTAYQIRVMADNGYKLTTDGTTIGNAWKTGVIHTPKGLINYW
jgi:hypothetical protein